MTTEKHFRRTNRNLLVNSAKHRKGTSFFLPKMVSKGRMANSDQFPAAVLGRVILTTALHGIGYRRILLRKIFLGILFLVNIVVFREQFLGINSPILCFNFHQ
jgi:hypothetical protein